MNSSFDLVMSMRRFDAITIVLAAPIVGEDYAAIRAMLGDALAERAGVPEAGQWTIEPFGDAPADTFDLIPPDGHTISDKLAFDIRNALADRDDVAYAEALFDVVATITADEVAEDGEEAAELRADIASSSIFGGDSWWDALTTAEQDVDWNHKVVGTTDAWAAAGQGEGILIGHPDTGYIPHFELDDESIDDANGYDFVDNDADTVNAANRGGNHGLGTSSVIVSKTGATDQPRTIFGVAPEATIIPFRIAPNWAPVFFTPVGPRRLRNAVQLAREKRCHVISMSLGGLGSRTLHEEIRKAVEENMIVVAAAGNYVGFVVWPALYDEVIAVAACDADERPWAHSSRGRAVEVTAPGHHVWRAQIDENGLPTVRPGSGTSYATPHVAAAAALWLKKHGRETLLETYEGTPLTHVFRDVLRRSCDPIPGEDGTRFGAGILNIPKLLAAELPVLDGDGFGDGGISFGLAATDEPETVDAFCGVFDEVPRATTRARLAELLGVEETGLDATLEAINGDELLMRVVTSPDLRAFFAAPAAGAEGDVASDISMAEGGQAMARSTFLELDLSDDLRRHISG